METIKNCWHVCTEGLKNRLMFRDVSDFVEGMNGIALCSVGQRVAILAFCLMDNHVHFVLNGEQENVRRFITRFKKRMGEWVARKYQERNAFHGLGTFVKYIDSRNHLLKVISYVHRNPLAAGICTPNSYEWSSASVFFSQRLVLDDWYKIGDITCRRVREDLKTHLKVLPDSFLVDGKNMVLPQNYICIQYIEKIFETATNYLYNLNTNRDAEVEMTLMHHRKAFDDGTIRNQISTICKEEFGSENFNQLDFNGKCGVAITLRKRFGCGVKQIARLTGMQDEFLKQLLGLSEKNSQFGHI